MNLRQIYGVKFLDKFNIAAIVLYPFMLFADKKEDVSARLMRHEMEHVEQVRRWGFFSFYVSYLLFYLGNLLIYKNHGMAYWKIPHEIQARDAEEEV